MHDTKAWAARLSFQARVYFHAASTSADALEQAKAIARGGDSLARSLELTRARDVPTRCPIHGNPH